MSINFEDIGVKSVETRLALLEQQAESTTGNMLAIKTAIEKLQEDVNQLVQMTTIGKAAWKSIVWLGAFGGGIITVLYFLTQLKLSWHGLLPIPHIPTSSSTNIVTP